MNGHATASRDYGAIWLPLSDRIGRLEADHRVLQADTRHMRGDLDWLEGQHLSLASTLREEVAATSASLRSEAASLGTEMRALRERVTRGLLWLGVFAGGLATGASGETGRALFAAVKAHLGG